MPYEPVNAEAPRASTSSMASLMSRAFADGTSAAAAVGSAEQANSVPAATAPAAATASGTACRFRPIDKDMSDL
jgi:hypothetical protein